MTHVFIVNDTTFKVHLEYMFAGTGASKDAPFLVDSQYTNTKKSTDGLTPAGERNLTAMIADVSRIRPGDSIIFYLQATSKHQGMFFGVFKAKSRAFYQPTDEEYLNSELEKALNFRVLIQPDTVYPKGITEHELLDRIDGVNHPSEMCWSLIYRKLKGNRGCTMITDYESNKLKHKLEEKNNNQFLRGQGFTYSTENKCIVTGTATKEYTGNTLSLSIDERLIKKYKDGHAFETHLQAYIMQHYDEEPLRSMIAFDCNWVGNEVSCGVGMQRIDSMFVSEYDDRIIINVVELKCVVPYLEIVTDQLPWYVDWIKDYLIPLYDRKVIIQPIIVAKEFSNSEDTQTYKSTCESFMTEDNNDFRIREIQFVSYNVENNELSFNIEF